MEFTQNQLKMIEKLGIDKKGFEKPEEKTEDLMLEVLADHEERICLMELGIEEVVV